MPFAIGSVIKNPSYQGSMRVLACDEVEVLYDTWWEHAQSWSMKSLRRSASYLRIPTKHLLENTEILRIEPLTGEENAVHRPDLPLRLLRSTQARWSNADYPNSEALVDSLDRLPADLDLASDEIVLDLPSIALRAYGPMLGAKKAVLVHAENGRGFTAPELYWQANRLQAPFFEYVEEGIGLYRGGFFKKTPMYYTWGALDLARFAEPLPGYQSRRTGTFWERDND